MKNDDPGAFETGCPEPEALAAFVDGRLEGAEKTRVEEHVAGCEDCYALFSETVRFQAETAERPERTPRRTFGPGTTWLFALAAALVIAAGLWTRTRPMRSPGPIAAAPIAELVRAMEGERAMEPRLAGGFRYASPREVTRSGAPARTPSWKVLAAAARIKEESERGRSVDGLAALGVAHLALGEADQGIAALEKALAARRRDAAVLTDLSAGYLFRAKTKDDAEDIVRALNAADAAIDADPALLEPRFNRALAFEALGRPDQAAQAWRDYLAKDASSEWAAEARQRLAAIKPVTER